MDRVHAKRLGAEDAGERAARLEVDVLADGEALVLDVGDRRPVVHPPREEVELRDQRPAEGDVQLLHAAADGEERHATADRGADQGEGEGVAVGVVGLGFRRRRGTVEGGVDVRAAAGEEDAVDPVEEGVEVDPAGERRHHERDRAEAEGDRL